jgi:4a-hydroxytetrahydrobiopterin dehydratase
MRRTPIRTLPRMPDHLSAKTCTPCRGGIPPLDKSEAMSYLSRVPGWALDDDARRLQHSFKFGNFGEALDFVRELGELAEREGHHPEVSFGWGWATVSWHTKKIKGLHENDFIMAAKTSELANKHTRTQA